MNSSNVDGGSFDLQSKLLKGPGFAWAKYPGEYHLSPSYNYLGPGTRTDIRLDQNKQPKVGEEPNGPVDAIALNHDIRYEQADQSDEPLRNKHEADLIMISELDKIDPSNFRDKFAKWLATTALKLKLKLGMAIDKSTGTPMDSLYSPAHSKFWIDLFLLQAKNNSKINPEIYTPEYVKEMEKNANYLKNLISGGSFDYSEEAKNLVKNYMSELKKDDKEYADYKKEEERKKREIPFMEQVAELIEKPFRWLTEWTTEQIPGVKDYISFDKLQNLIMGKTKWQIREQANVLDEAIKQLDDQINQYHTQDKFSYNSPEIDDLYSKVRTLREQRDELKKVLGYGLNGSQNNNDEQSKFADEVWSRVQRKFK